MKYLLINWNFCSLLSIARLWWSMGTLSNYVIVIIFFFRKVDNVMQGLKCAVQNCDEKNITIIHESVHYVKSVVGKRCPSLSDDRHCDSMMTGIFCLILLQPCVNVKSSFIYICYKVIPDKALNVIQTMIICVLTCTHHVIVWFLILMFEYRDCLHLVTYLLY